MKGASPLRADMAGLKRYARTQSKSGRLKPDRGPLKVTGPLKLWDLAGRIYHEALLQGSLSAAGSNTQRLVERMDNDSGYIKRQARLAQIMGSFYLLFVASLPAASLRELANGSTHVWNMFVASVAGTIHMGVQTGYLMILTLVATSEILAPDLYRWPESLPLRDEQNGMLRVMALAREFLLPLSVIVLSYPIVVGITGGLVAAVATLGISTMHALFTLSLTVLASWRLRRALRSTSGSGRRAAAIRVFTMAGYGLGIVLILGIMQFGTGLISSLFDNPRMNAAESLQVLRILAFLPLPTSAATLVSGLVARHAALSGQLPLWMPLVGTALYGSLTLLLLRSAWRLLGQREDADAGVTRVPPARGVTHPGSAEETAINRIEIARLGPTLVARSARAAFRRQIFQAATRDTQVLLALLFPLVIPLAMLTGPAISGNSLDLLFTIEPVVATLLGGWIVINGLTRLQTGTGLLESTLPLLERDRAFPRLLLCAIVPAIGSVIATLALMPSELKVQALVMSTIPAIGVPVGFLIKTALFGRIRATHRHVVVEEVYLDHRFLKWLLVLVSVLAVAVSFILLQMVIARAVEGFLSLVLFAAVVGVAGVIVRFVAGRIFPPAVRS